MECSYCGSWRTNAVDSCPACGGPAVGAGARPVGAALRAWLDARQAQAALAAQEPARPALPDIVAGGNTSGRMGLLARYGGTGKVSAVSARPAAAAPLPSPVDAYLPDDVTSIRPAVIMAADVAQTVADPAAAAIGMLPVGSAWPPAESLPDVGEPEIASDRALLPADLPELRFPTMDMSTDPRAATVYIPASLPRRRYTMSNWHIISGVASLLIMLLMVCALSGYWATTHFNLLAHRSLQPLPQPSLALSVEPDRAVPGPAAKIIQTAAPAKGISIKYEPIGIASTFATGQYVYIVYKVRSKQPGTVTCEWYQNGVELEPQEHPVLGSVNGYFAMSFPSAGTGKAQLLWNGTLAQTIAFTIMDK
jgi:hypothetical protein